MFRRVSLSRLPSVSSGDHGVSSAPLSVPRLYQSGSSEVAEETDAGVALSVALSAGEGGRRSVSVGLSPKGQE